MKTIFRTKGQVVRSPEVRARVALHPGRELEVTAKKGGILITPMEKGRNERLMDTLLN